ncbi:Rieske (2Fe-2S) protein [Catenuloplanes atrovinosus]|uniref:Nitrite reductase/ring-hydroxylating ferredoxin subunit n=1 Tax=Catenuloplanes atrovinosus TaxID=137266 RepID=A0AAE4CDJ0_9ACTN|nr:Rieske (2Fe-2S) protein [Catenuloplanes atrovinosus]MDR7279104.1 nitrite reductase/ring-hydroxylating ferredoxin subunit [Catenuloplanes atrovinosus]
MVLQRLLERVEKTGELDRAGDPLQRRVQATLPRRLKDLLHGVGLGHPLHPVAVQLPVGAWMSTAVLDALPGTERAATILVGVGAAAALPAAASGATDWSEQSREQRRVGLVHAAANTVALGFYVGSFAARLAGNHRLGRRLAYTGLAAAGLGAYVGGHLSFRQAAATNQAEPFLRQIDDGWHDVYGWDELVDGRPEVARIGEVPVLVTRVGDRVTVMMERCAHQTGPLGDGEITEIGGAACVVCPWHGSTFRLADGAVVRGPSANDQPLLRSRVVEGRVQASLP